VAVVESSYESFGGQSTLLVLGDGCVKVYNRTREGNFSLERLGWGFDIHGKTVGIVGTGKIGQCFARIMKGEAKPIMPDERMVVS